MFVRTIFLIWILHHQSTAMFIPQDVEILDGFDLEESAEYYPSDTSYYEAKSLASGLTKSIRNRRSPLYQPTYTSDSSSSSQSVPFVNSDERKDGKSLRKNEDNPLKLDAEIIHTNENGKLESRNLPTPEKQTMDADFYKRGGWNDRHHYYGHGQQDHLSSSSYGRSDDDDDSLAESTNEGIRGRTPRVNFITQPKSQKDEIKERPIVTKNTPQVGNSRSHYEKYEPTSYDLYPSRSYDQYLRRYDRFDDQYNRYDPYNYDDYYVHRRHFDPYDSYSPRVPSYPEPYYNYPDRRYDVPEPRDYRPLYNNDIYDRMPAESDPASSYSNKNNRRIIYYAHLPEVVRTPPSIDYNTYRYDRNHNYGAYGGTASGAYRVEDAKAKTSSFAFVKREKKDHRNQSGPTVAPNHS